MYFKLVLLALWTKSLGVDALFYMCQIISVLLFSSINYIQFVEMCLFFFLFFAISFFTQLFKPLQQQHLQSLSPLGVTPPPSVVTTGLLQYFSLFAHTLKSVNLFTEYFLAQILYSSCCICHSVTSYLVHVIACCVSICCCNVIVSTPWI